MSADGRRGRPLSQGEIEAEILAVVDTLEVETDQYRHQAEASANAEATYRYAVHSWSVKFADDPNLPKMTVAEREHRIGVQVAAQLRTYKVAEARKEATREALWSLRARLDALRTLSANVRVQT